LGAWEHGPVVKSIYNEYKSFGRKGIVPGDGINCPEDNGLARPKFDRETTDMLMRVHRGFAWHTASELRNMTHSEDPWKNTPRNKVIPQSFISDYFKAHYEFE
jgi:uncharacterized phage-associated protein